MENNPLNTRSAEEEAKPSDAKDEPQTVRQTNRVGYDNYQLQTINVFGNNAADTTKYDRFFVAPYPMEIVEGWATWENAASGGGSPTVSLVRMVKNQDALSAGQNLLSASFDVTGTVNQVHRIRAQNVISARFINNGDTLGLYPAGTFTGVSSFIATIVMRPITTTLSRFDTP